MRISAQQLRRTACIADGIAKPRTAELAFTVPADAPLTQPYWLREDADVGVYHVDDPRLIGDPESPPSFVVDYTFEIGGQTLAVPDEPVAVTQDARGGRRRRVDVIPPATLAFAPEFRCLRLEARVP